MNEQHKILLFYSKLHRIITRSTQIHKQPHDKEESNNYNKKQKNIYILVLLFGNIGKKSF